MGVRERIIFNRLYDKVDRVRGFGYYHYTTAKSTKRRKAVLSAMPLTSVPQVRPGLLNGFKQSMKARGKTGVAQLTVLRETR